MNLFHNHTGTVRLGVWPYLLVAAAALVHPPLSDLWSSLVAPDASEHCDQQLDSFSGPAIASAVLTEEAERLRSACIECRQREWQASVLHPELHGTVSPQHVSLLKSMEQLQREVKALRTDVNLKLMSAYAESGLWAEFLNHYLEFLQETPENTHVVTWALCSLIHAEECGRTHEVELALERTALVTSNPSVATRLRKVLADRTQTEPLPLELQDP